MTASVSARAEIDIAAGEREVWTVIADIGAWPTWNPAVREAVFGGELEAGARFRFSTAFGSIKCRLSEVDAPRTLAWTGRLLSVRERQAWQLAPNATGTHVSIESSLSGIGARLFRRRLQERLDGELDATVQLLKLEAEVRSTEDRELAARDAPADG